MSAIVNAMMGAAGAGGAGGFAVDNGAVLNDGDSEHFTKTFSSATSNQKQFTIAGWYKRGPVDTYDILFGAVGASATAGRVQAYFHGDGRLVFEIYHGSGWFSITTTRKFRDPHAWLALMFVYDVDNSTSSDKMRIWCNGSRISDFDSTSYPTSSLNHLMFHNSQPTTIGNSGDNNYYAGYMAQVVGLDGQALTDMSKVGEEDSNGVWRPIDPTDGLTFSGNSFYLPFTASGALGADYSTTRTAPSVSFLTSAYSTSNTSSYTFSSQSLGTAASDRKIYVGVGASAVSTAYSFSSVTVAGVTATQIVAGNADNNNSFQPFAIYEADVPSGTTGDVVVNLSGTMANCAIALYRATGAGPIVYSDATNGGSFPSPNTVSLAAQAPKNSVVLSHGNKNGQTVRVTLAGVTEAYDFGGESDMAIFGGINTSATSSDAVGLTTSATVDSGSASYLGIATIVIGGVGDTSFKAVNSPTQTTDSPTDNRAVITPLATSASLSNGNLTVNTTTGAGQSGKGSIPCVVGNGNEYVFEAKLLAKSGSANPFIGVADAGSPTLPATTDYRSYASGSHWLSDGQLDGLNASHAYGSQEKASGFSSTFTTNDVIGVVVKNSGAVHFYKNGSQVFVSSDQTNISVLPAGDWFPSFGQATGGSQTSQWEFRFGDDMSHTYGSAVKLTTSALFGASAPTVGNISNGYVAVTATEANIVSTLGAAHSYSSYMELYANRDSGEDKILKFSDDASNHLEFSSSNAKASFPSLTGSAAWVGYAFNMSSTYGMFTDQVSHSTGSDTDTAHGLGANVGMVFVKREDATGQWFMLTSGNSSGYNQIWEYPGSPVAGNSGQQNSTVYAGYDGTNIKVLSAAPTGTYRVIAFANVPGFLDLRTYDGNGQADGTFVYTGHSCDWVCVFGVGTSQSAYEKLTVDSTREPGNPKDLEIALANPSTGEDGDKGAVLGDSLSNGFKHRDGSAPNSTTNPYFMWSYGSPANGQSPETAR